MKIIPKNFNEIEVIFSIDETVYLNATKVAKQFKKDVREWKRSKQTIEYIDALADVENLHSDILIKTFFGGNDKKAQGTWIHKKLIISFARWLSPNFAVWCDLQIEDILKSKNLQPPLDKRVKLIRQSRELFDDFEYIFKKIGISEQTELAITTNRAVKEETTIDFIAISGQNGLEVEEEFFTVTKLCELIRKSDKYSDEIKKLVSTKNNLKPQPINLNKILETQGFQVGDSKQWKTTKKGESFAKFVQNKSITSTKNIFHLNWKIEVLEELF